MKTDNDIENILERQQQVSLTASEKAGMKSALLEHATTSLSHEQPPVAWPHYVSHWWKQAAMSFASLLIVFAGTGYVSADSLPGEPLYVVKVHVVEELVGLSKFTAEDKLEYDTSLMKERLEELKELSESDAPLSDEDLELIHEKIDDHINDILLDVEASQTSGEEAGENIETLSDLNTITQAQENVIKSHRKFTPITEDITDARRGVDAALESEVDEFVTESTPEEVTGFLNDQLDQVVKQIDALNPEDSTTDLMAKLLNDANESLVEGDLREAITTLIEAEDAVEIDAYAGEEVDEAEPVEEVRGLQASSTLNVE